MRDRFPHELYKHVLSHVNNMSLRLRMSFFLPDIFLHHYSVLQSGCFLSCELNNRLQYELIDELNLKLLMSRSVQLMVLGLEMLLKCIVVLGLCDVNCSSCSDCLNHF